MTTHPDRSGFRSGSIGTVALLAMGFFFMLISLGFEIVTVRGSYAGVLIAALIFTVLANICLVTAYRRGGTTIRIACVLGMLPTLFVIVEGSYRLFHSLTP